MGGASSRGGVGVFNNMNEEQPLTPTPPRRDIAAPSRHFTISPPWTPHNGSDQLHNDNSPSDEAISSDILEPASPCDSVHEQESIRPEPVSVDNAGATMSPAHDLTSSTVRSGAGGDEPEQYLVEITPPNMRLKLDSKSTPATETQSRKKRLVNLFRTLSASAASSSVRMTPKSSVADRSLMVDDRHDTHNDAIDEEEPSTPDHHQLADSDISPTDEPPSRPSSAARSVFSIGRRSPHPSSGQRTSKYAPMDSDD